jgi:acetylornithine/succinyldiaminopimelate/putrescine aminotransferase
MLNDGGRGTGNRGQGSGRGESEHPGSLTPSPAPELRIPALQHPHELQVFARLPLRPVKGLGCCLWDAEGRRFLDLYGGHAVAVTGHCHPRVVAAIREQAGALLFYSNAVPIDARDRLFSLLAELAPAELDRVFLVNSGAEANEAALMLARRVTGRARVVSVAGGFHGRSLATLAASGIDHYRGLAAASGAGTALLDLTAVCPFGDTEALAALVDGGVAALIVEPVQGLAGARECSPGFLRAARAACDRAGTMLVFDEVQCGCGRTGAFTAAQAYGVTPDLLTLAKGIGGGLPMGAVLIGESIASQVGVGEMGTTFGGGPVPCAAAAANLAVIRDEALPERAVAMEAALRAGLGGMAGVVRVQGRGLLLGVVLDRPAKPVQRRLFEAGILVGSAEDAAVLRLLPPLVLGEEEVDTFLAALREVLT